MRRICMTGVACVLTATGVARADFLAIDLNFEFSGASAPSGSGPWLRAEFSSTTAGEVDLKLISLLSGSQEKVGVWAFNLDTAFDPTDLLVTQDSGPAIDGYATGTDAFKADGDGFFDLRFDFPNNGDTFGMGDVAEFTITSTDAITASSFAFLSVNGPVGKTGFLSAAHVQGIGAQGEDSGWIAPTVIPLPAPAYLGLAGLGLAAMVGAIKRRR